MSRNGWRSPPRPRIEVLGPATEPEAAAIAAALERFLADTAPPPAPADAVSRWQQAGLREGVGRDPGAAWWGTR